MTETRKRKLIIMWVVLIIGTILLGVGLNEVAFHKDAIPAERGRYEARVYITEYGDHFHSGSCRYLHSSKIAISRKDAISAGYTACSACGGYSSGSIYVEGGEEIPAEDHYFESIIIVAISVTLVVGIFWWNWIDKSEWQLAELKRKRELQEAEQKGNVEKNNKNEDINDKFVDFNKDEEAEINSDNKNDAIQYNHSTFYYSQANKISINEEKKDVISPHSKFIAYIPNYVAKQDIEKGLINKEDFKNLKPIFREMYDNENHLIAKGKMYKTTIVGKGKYYYPNGQLHVDGKWETLKEWSKHYGFCDLKYGTIYTSYGTPLWRGNCLSNTHENYEGDKIGYGMILPYICGTGVLYDEAGITKTMYLNGNIVKSPEDILTVFLISKVVIPSEDYIDIYV